MKYDEGDDCMIKNLLIVRVDSNYCDYLRKFDTKVAYNMNEKELRHQKLLKEQLAWLNANYIQVKDKSYKLYILYNKGRLPKNIRERCCNFKLLEEKCLEYTERKNESNV